MIDINELRDRAATFGSDYLTDEEWVEVIDRLEAAESDGLEQARLLGMSCEREAALLSKLEAAEKAVTEAYQRGYKTGQEEIGKERDALRVEVERLTECLHRANAQAEHFEREWYLRGEEVDALCAELEALKNQEPVAWMNSRNGFICKENKNPDYNLPLYARPIPAQSVPEGYHRCAQFKKENDELRAKIEAMERQEPVAWLHESRRDSDVVTNAVKHVWGKAAVGSMAAYSIPLYTLPGAKGDKK